MPVEVLKGLDNFRELINGDRPVVIDFWATWCGPCRMISPVLDKLSDEKETQSIGFYKVDVDDQPDIAQEVGIRAMPTFVLFHRGEKVDELVGANPSKLQVGLGFFDRPGYGLIGYIFKTLVQAAANV